MKTLKTILIAAAAVSLQVVLADQPVHCVTEEILGKWNFKVSESFDVDLFNIDTICTHKAPNRLQILRHGEQFDFATGFNQEYTVNLKQPNIARIVTQDRSVEGTWSIMYDQGVFVETDELRFIVNFKYTVKPESISRIEELSTSSYADFDSMCNETMVGFVQYRQTPGKMSCFYGLKEVTDMLETTAEVLNDEETQVSYFQPKRQHFGTLSQKKYDEMSDLVDFVNTNSFTWKADFHPRFKGLTLAEVHSRGRTEEDSEATRLLGATNTLGQTDSTADLTNEQLLHDEDFQAARAVAMKYWDYRADNFPEKELPDSWDWRNVNGYDFTSPLRDQGSCGSCYTVSFIQALESRIKIRYGQQHQLSAQFILTCNPFNEGCQGGWPIHNGFFAESFYIPLEECAPYKASTTGRKCSDYEHCQKAVRVEKSAYIGGFYGSSSELAMMSEIRAHGPIVGDLEVPVSFSYYKQGIFSDDHAKALEALKGTKYAEQINQEGTINDRTNNDYNIQWELINHSILIIGWGEENGVKFWICRNSYGAHWGENGYFRVRRGSDDYAIESEPSSYIPILLI